VNYLELIEEYDDVFSNEELDEIHKATQTPRWEITNSNPEQGERTLLLRKLIVLAIELAEPLCGLYGTLYALL